MTGPELARFLGPLVGATARPHLASLMLGRTNDIALRYDHITDWDKLGALLIDKVDEIQLIDGQEWFTLDLEPMNDQG